MSQATQPFKAKTMKSLPFTRYLPKPNFSTAQYLNPYRIKSTSALPLGELPSKIQAYDILNYFQPGGLRYKVDTAPATSFTILFSSS